MSKSRFSAEANEVFARYEIDEGALSRGYDEAFKRAFAQSRECDDGEVRQRAKNIEVLLDRARDSLDRLAQEFGCRFAASEEGLTEALGKVRAQSDVIAGLVREGERRVASAAVSSGELATIRLHDAWAKTMKHHLKESAQSTRASHRLLLEACAYAFTCVARHNDRAEGYAFVLKSSARLTAEFAHSLSLLALVANLRSWCSCIDQRLKSGDTLHTEALELYCELADLTLEQLASE